MSTWIGCSLGSKSVLPLTPRASSSSLGAQSMSVISNDVFISVLLLAVGIVGCRVFQRIGERLILFFDRFRRRALSKFTLFFFDKEVADVTSNDF